MKFNAKLQKLPFIFFLFTWLSSCNNNTGIENADANPVKSASPYKFDVPQGWTVERISFPIDFAPGINYTGVEDLRFTPGWEDLTSEEHWSYTFLWWLNGKPKIDADILRQNLTEYYSGLVKRNILKRSIPQIKIVPTLVTIKNTETLKGDSATYKGIISMLDYIAQSPMILNCLVHIKSCDTQKHTAVVFGISPKSYDHPLWQKLNSLATGFKCEE